MKQLSSKKRKIRFIREKNYFRSGKPLRTITKISNELRHDVDAEEMTEHIIQTAVLTFSTRYKLPFRFVSMDVAQMDTDFIYDRFSVILTLKAA